MRPLFKHSFSIPLLSGTLLGLSYTGIGLALFCFVAFALLLLYHEQHIKQGKSIHSFGIWIYFCFALFNTIACSWISVASVFGGLSEIFINSAIMTTPWIIYAWAHRLKGHTIAKLVLLVLWLGMEYMHTHWELAWPWLHLGNSFAFQPWLVQWYQYTGAAGGTAWLLLLAISADAVRLQWSTSSSQRAKLTETAMFLFLLIVPIIISVSLHASSIQDASTKNIMIVQPNFDPYGEDGHTYRSRLASLIEQTDAAMDSSVQMILWPEVAVEGGLWENDLAQRPDFQPVLDLSARWPVADIIVGASTYRLLADSANTATARSLPMGGMYDAYNSLIHVRNGHIQSIRHKSQLVLGVEKIPFPEIMRYASSTIDWLGGSVGSLGSDDSLIVFSTRDGGRVASLICYESVFGAFASSQQASLITIHTNDGWWGNTLGHRQHFAYSRLRAIEAQRYVGRCAYNGISGIIAPDGSVVQQLPYMTAGVLRAEVPLMAATTFYQHNGDFIGRWATFFSIIILVYLAVQSKIGTRR
jgi:apolipoprotein N-acyltransferase